MAGEQRPFAPIDSSAVVFFCAISLMALQALLTSMPSGPLPAVGPALASMAMGGSAGAGAEDRSTEGPSRDGPGPALSDPGTAAAELSLGRKGGAGQVHPGSVPGSSATFGPKEFSRVKGADIASSSGWVLQQGTRSDAAYGSGEGQKQEDSKPANATQAEATPADVKQEEAKPAVVIQEETKPAGVTQEEIKPAGTTQEGAKPAGTESGHGADGQEEPPESNLNATQVETTEGKPTSDGQAGNTQVGYRAGTPPAGAEASAQMDSNATVGSLQEASEGSAGSTSGRGATTAPEVNTGLRAKEESQRSPFEQQSIPASPTGGSQEDGEAPQDGPGASPLQPAVSNENSQVGESGESNKTVAITEADECWGKRVYVYENLPQIFSQVLTNCSEFCKEREERVCVHLPRDGLGHDFQEIVGFNDSYGDSTYTYGPWLPTEQHMLGILFGTRLKSYTCLTTQWEAADIFYVPAYFGLLDICDQKGLVDRAGDELEAFLGQQPGFKRKGGADHFTIFGQQIWSFMRGEKDGWGSYIVQRPSWKEMKFVSVERFVWEARIQSVPYPTAFHPADVDELNEWMRHVEGHPRQALVSIASGPRPGQQVRNAVMKACTDHAETCVLVDCHKDCPYYWCFHEHGFCADPRQLSTLTLNSTFCLQPPGDSLTRRSIFDSLIAGCIPVFFDGGSFHQQYKWNLPANRSEVALLFDGEKVRKGEIDFIEELKKVPEDTIKAMQAKIREIIPGLLFRDHTRYNPDKKIFKDALDFAIEGLVKDMATASHSLA